MQKTISSLGQRLCTNCEKLSLSHKVNAKLPLATVVTPGRTMSGDSKGQMASRLKGTEKNIWVEFGKLAAEYKCLNLGQGFPDFKPPGHVVKYMVDALNSDNALLSQYARSYGHPRLVNILSKLYAPFLKHEVNPMTDITVGIGAYGVLFSAVQGHVNPGDEVIIVEPYFDCYEPMAKVAGATPRYIPLRPTKEGGTSADWKIDPAELESLFNSKTKALIINNPNNPVGKVFSAEELQMVGDLCRKYNTICISDEVYEWLVFDGLKHVKMASLPGMWDHTITIGSGGKTFSATGWKIGWAIGPQKLIQPMQILHQNCVYTCPTPIQEAMAVGLEHELSLLDRPEECYLFSLAKETQEKRDYLVKMLTDMGWVCTVPEGGYFLMADGSKLNIAVPDDGSGDPKDFQFVRWMCREKKLAAIPPSAFYNPEHKSMGEKYVRFCFIKKQETLDKAAELFKEWKKAL